MFTVPFADLTPTRKIWVSPDGSNSNDGSKAHPYKTIQYALDHATPGTAVMVKAGTYAENIEFEKSGTPGHPIWLISADGKGAAHIKPGKDTTTATIQAFGEDYIVISGFDVSAGDKNANGIAVTQSGSNFSNMTHHVVIKNNIVHDAVDDGIKVAQGDYIYVVNNKVHHVGDQGIDFVAVNKSVIARNEISYTAGPAAMYIKGGSTDVLVANNLIAHAKVDGIVLGGWTKAKYMRPGYRGWEAKDVVVIDNEVHDVGKRPLNIIGAQNSDVIHNYLDGNPDYPTIINISASTIHDPDLKSFNITLKNNVMDRPDHWLHVDKGQGGGLVKSGNKFNGVWDGDAGLGSETFSYNLPWSSTTSTTQATTVSAETSQDQSSSTTQPAATAKSADTTGDEPAISKPATSDDVVAKTAAAADPAPHAEPQPAAARLAARDLFSDVDDGQAIPGIDSGPNASHPAAATAHAGAADAGHNAVAAVDSGAFRGVHEAADVAAVEQQIQQG